MFYLALLNNNNFYNIFLYERKIFNVFLKYDNRNNLFRFILLKILVIERSLDIQLFNEIKMTIEK